MATKDDEFLDQLRATFRIEAAEHLQAMAAGLLELEKARESEAPPRKIVETVFRAAHSLKGAARAVRFTDIELVCQSLEDVFASWKRRQAVPSAEALDAVHGALDAVGSALAAPGGALDTAALRDSLRHWSGVPDVAAPAARHARAAGNHHAAVPVPPGRAEVEPRRMAETVAAGETVRIAVAKLEARMLEAEELLTAKLAGDQRIAELRELADRFEAWRHAWAAIEPAARRLRVVPATTPAARTAAPAIPQLLDFLEWSVDYMRSTEDQAQKLRRAAEQDRRVVGKLVDDLLQNSKKLLLLPFGTLAAPLPRLVRDLCREQAKEAELVVRGEDIEVDKHILEELKDPLIHLLRNAVDHGIERPEERVRRGKPPRGTITLVATQLDAGKVELRVSDDGAGIDVTGVKGSAVRHGLLAEAEATRLVDSEALELVFQSDVSTSPVITQVSGRGLGLAIVREKAVNLGGTASVESRRGSGTTFRLVVPATRATFRGILVEAGGQRFVVPTAQVARVMRVRPDDVRTIEGRETVSLDGRALSLAQLASVLELPAASAKETPMGGAPAIVLGAGDQRVAFVVDGVLDEMDVLVKPLRKPLIRVRNVAAATVLGSGQVAPILHTADLLKSARKAAGTTLPLLGPVRAPAQKPRSILVAEDSITSRMLLKGILEAAGYDVKTAVDGMEAFGLLRAGHVDLVVSDVEMPRLNGFDLTARIRADRKLADLPVVLVTALETREDRERGIDAGANAYLVKSSFDQGSLLEAIERLIGKDRRS